MFAKGLCLMDTLLYLLPRMGLSQTLFFLNYFLVISNSTSGPYITPFIILSYLFSNSICISSISLSFIFQSVSTFKNKKARLLPSL